MGLPSPELAGWEETCTTLPRPEWDFQGRNWQVGRKHVPQELGTGRQGDGKRNLPQEMGHPRETNLPHDMGLPRPEWDFQGRNWQVGRKHVPQELGTGRQGDGKRNLPQEMGHPRETNLPHDMGLSRPGGDFQGRNWQVGRKHVPQELGTGRQGDGKRNLPQEMGHPRETNLPHDMGLPRPEWDFQARNWQVGRKHVPQELGTGRQGDGKRNLPQEMGHPRETNLPHDMGLSRPEWDFQGRNWQVGRKHVPQELGTGRQGDGKRNLPQEMGHPRETNLPHDMGLPRPEWDFQGRNWQVGRKHVPQELGTGRQGDGKRNLPQEMGHPRETNLPHDMGLPRPEWDFQGRNWQVGRKHVPQELGTGRQGDGKRNLPQEMGHLRWELAGRETVRGICRRRWDIQGRRIYHMTWDFQGRNGTSKAGTGRQGDGKRNLPQEMGHPRETNLPHDMGLPRPEWDFQGRNWQVGRKHVPQELGTGRQGDGKRNLPQEMGHPRETNLPHDMGLPRPEWDFQGRNWQVGRKHVPQELGTGRQGDGKRNLPQEMGHLRWELAGRETVRGICRRRWDIQGRRIYHMTWDFQGRNGTSKAGTGRLGGNMYHRSWELAGRETGRGIYRRRWDI